MKIIDTAQLDFNALSTNEREWIYNGFDAAVTFEIRDVLRPQLDNATGATYSRSLALQAPIMEMSLRGLLVDQSRRVRMLRHIMNDIEILQANLKHIVEEGIGYKTSVAKGKDPGTWWRSNLQLMDVMYNVLGIKPIMKRGTKGERVPTIDRGALEKLTVNYLANPLCRHILVLRDLDKKRSFLETGIDPDGRFRYGFNIAGTNTGRLSSSESDLGTGSNAQNVGRSLRSIFCADPGMKFGNLDLEQADSRNLGAICWELFHHILGSKAGAYLDACESGDLHTFVARMANPQLPWPEDKALWRKIADEIAYRDFSHRDMAKKLGHGTNYYGTPVTMAMHTKIPRFQVADFQKGYFTAFPEIALYHQWVKDQLLEFATITTLFGRRRHFFGRPADESTIREAIAYSPQSMTAEEINIGLLNVWRGNRVQLLVQVHDSILFQYPEELEDEIIPWALNALRAPLPLSNGRSFCVPVEAKVGWNWGDKAEDNPDGLVKFKGHDDRKRTEFHKPFFRR